VNHPFYWRGRALTFEWPNISDVHAGIDAALGVSPDP
jgi:hypothetical protein